MASEDGGYGNFLQQERVIDELRAEIRWLRDKKAEAEEARDVFRKELSVLGEKYLAEKEAHKETSIDKRKLSETLEWHKGQLRSCAEHAHEAIIERNELKKVVDFLLAKNGELTKARDEHKKRTEFEEAHSEKLLARIESLKTELDHTRSYIQNLPSLEVVWERLHNLEMTNRKLKDGARQLNELITVDGDAKSHLGSWAPDWYYQIGQIIAGMLEVR